ncbi:hypothetical protein HCU40_09485 [Pseudanabaena biceps]|nr:hypothetical protein [Pseudanabaena biceps]
MPNSEVAIIRQKITYQPEITLAMYRELASHIEQIENISCDLFGQESLEFSYLGSQIGGIWLAYPQNLSPDSKNLMSNILNHYGKWKIFSDDKNSIH